MTGVNLKKDFDKINKNICKINDIIGDEYYNEPLKIIKQNEEKKKLSEEIKSYLQDYQKFQNIKRFSIPIIGKINCGKSTILNYLLNLDDILQYSCDTTTKFVSIIRHNKKLKEKSPLIYNVKFEERAYINKIHLYNFEKDGDNIPGEVKEIIKTRNEQLINKQLDELPENYFYIIESYIPLFEGNLEQYSDFFEFMDVPGLNESSLEENKENVYLDKVIPLFINNVKFAMFVFDTMNYERRTDSIINNRDIFSIFYDKMNEFYKEYNIKEIKNSIFILNKIDKSDRKGGIDQEKKDFKDYLQYKLNVQIKDNYLIFFRADKEYLSRIRFNTFDKYLDFIHLRDNGDKNIFKEKLINNLKKDLRIKNMENNNDEDDEEENEEEEEEKQKDELSKKIRNFNESLRDKLYSDRITKSDYLFYKKYYDDNISNAKKDFKKDEITKHIEKSIITFNQDFNDNKNNKLTEFYNDIKKELNYQEDDLEDIKKKDESKIITFKNFYEQKDYQKTLNYEENIFKELLELEPNHEYIKKIREKFLYEKDYILNKYKYKIALFGEYSSGKSSILNSLIGKDLLPDGSDHCTKVIIIIQYTKYEKDISLYSSKKNTENSNNYIYYFMEDKLLEKGEESVKKKLKSLNSDYQEGISYYILNTPIKFLDEFIEEEKIKNQIQFFDMPGLDSLKKEYTETDFPKLIKHIDLFIYTNGMNIILQKESELAIKKMLDFILSSKGYFKLDSMIFIINFYDELQAETKEKRKEKMKNFKDSIYKIIKNYKESDWNRYINYSNIIDKNEEISCFFFSKILFKEEQKKKFDILDFNNFFKKLNQEYSTYETSKKILEIKKYMKKNYINSLSNKKDFSDGIHIEGNLEKYRNDLKSILNIKKNSESEEIQNNINSIVIMYNFFLKYQSNFNYKFNDFLITLKEKISKEDNKPFLNIIFQMTLSLSRSLRLIKSNIIRWKNNLNNENSFKNKFSNIRDSYKNKIENEFSTKIKELENYKNNMIKGENKSQEIEKTIKDLLNNIENLCHSYFKSMKKEMRKIEYNLFLDFSHIVFYFDFTKKYYMFLGGVNTLITTIGYGVYGYLGIALETALYTVTFPSMIFGGFIGLIVGGIVGIMIYSLGTSFSKFISSLFNKNKMNRFFNEMKSSLEAIKFKIKNEIDDLYYSLQEKNNEDILSQEKPMKNLIENPEKGKKFNLLKDEYEKFLKAFNEKESN